MKHFPAYLKAVDPDGHTVALICHEDEGKTIILQPVTATDRMGYEVNIRQVRGEDELKAQIGGLIVDVSPEEYNETLFTTWGFDGSSVYRASDDLTGEDENAEPNKEKTDGNENGHTGSPDAAGGGSAEGTSQSEQPSDAGQEGLGEVPAGDEAGDASKPDNDLGNGDAENGEHDVDDGNSGQGDVAPGAEPAPVTNDNPVDDDTAGSTNGGDEEKAA